MEHHAETATASLLKGDSGAETYGDMAIPTWGDLQTVYERRWLQEKNKFQTQLKTNFFALVERFASGKQEVYVLGVPILRRFLLLVIRFPVI